MGNPSRVPFPSPPSQIDNLSPGIDQTRDIRVAWQRAPLKPGWQAITAGERSGAANVWSAHPSSLVSDGCGKTARHEMESFGEVSRW